MTEALSLAAIAGALVVGVVSPGPSFVMVARTAVASSRIEGLAAAVGMGLGGVVFAVAALVGLHGLLLAVPSLYIVLKLAGGLYLAYLGVRIWLAAKQPLAGSVARCVDGSHTAARALGLGFTTQVSNPKAAIVYAGVFAAFLPEASTFEFGAAIVALVFVIETGWYALVALALSSEAPRHAYLRFKLWIDRVAGGFMILLGLQLAFSHRARVASP